MYINIRQFNTFNYALVIDIVIDSFDVSIQTILMYVYISRQKGSITNNIWRQKSSINKIIIVI